MLPFDPLLPVGSFLSSVAGGIVGRWVLVPDPCPPCQPSLQCSAVTCPACHCTCGSESAAGRAASEGTSFSPTRLLVACALSAALGALLTWFQLRFRVRHHFAHRTVGEVTFGPAPERSSSRAFSTSSSTSPTPREEPGRALPTSSPPTLAAGVRDIAVWQPRRKA